MNYINRLFLVCSVALAPSCHIFAPTTHTPNNVLGFDPQISTIPLAYSINKTPVITVLGFPDPITMYAGKFDTPTTFTVTFSFHNNLAYSALLQPLKLISSYRSINVGQELDGQTLLFVVVECYKKGYTKVDIFANSRGGGATLSMLDMLSNPEQYLQIWQRLGITDIKLHDAIRTMVANGRIFLAHPLMDQDIAMRNSVDLKVDKFWILPGGGALKRLIYSGLKTLLCWTTRYNPDYPTPLAILHKNINEYTWPYDITLALAQQDEMVGHSHEPLLCSLAQAQPEKLKLMRGGKGHCDIKQLVKDFRASLNSRPA